MHILFLTFDEINKFTWRKIIGGDQGLERVLYWIFMPLVLCVIYKHLAWGEMLDCIVPIWYFGYIVVVSVVLIVEGYLLICGRCGGTCTFIVYSCDVAIGSSWTMDGCNRAIYGWEWT